MWLSSFKTQGKYSPLRHLNNCFKTPLFFLFISEVVPLLFQVINAQDSRSRENVNATENAISAVAKICKYNRGNIALNEVVPALIDALPITEDKEEAPHVYGYLCDLIEGYVTCKTEKWILLAPVSS